MQPFMTALGYGALPNTSMGMPSTGTASTAPVDPLNKQGLMYSNLQPQMPPSLPGGTTPTVDPGTGSTPTNSTPSVNTQPSMNGSGSSPSSAQPQQQQFSPTQQAGQLMDYLNSRFQNYGTGNVPGVSPFNPSANPFTPSFSNSPIMGPGGQAEQFSQNWMNTPSRYDTPLAKNTYDLMNQTLQQQQDASIQQNNADAASRGLFYSTIPQGTEGDIRIRTAQAQSQLANSILQNQAQTISQDRSAALSGALGYTNQQFSQELGKFGAGLQGQGQAFGQQTQSLADLLGASQQQFQNQMSSAQFNQSQDNMQNQLMLSLLGVA